MVSADLLFTLRTVLVAWLKIAVSTPKLSTTATRVQICLFTNVQLGGASGLDSAPVATVRRRFPADGHAGDAVFVGNTVGADKDCFTLRLPRR